MLLSRILDRILPQSVHARRRISQEQQSLKGIPVQRCEGSNLRTQGGLSLAEILSSREGEAMWRECQTEIASLGITDSAHGVNLGDRRAVHQLICHLRPQSVLEVGTHIGASTVHIAWALRENAKRGAGRASLTSVDIIDVNCPQRKHWVQYGMQHSPRQMIEKLHCGDFVRFIADTSLHFAQGCQDRFDFIFLDGDHSGATVYQEVPLALGLLKPGGIILLHDYFPDAKPLWPNGKVIPGPYLAIQRLISEGANLRVAPLGALPWPTKLGTNVTSLALLMRGS